jgi:hypothetical protein
MRLTGPRSWRAGRTLVAVAVGADVGADGALRAANLAWPRRRDFGNPEIVLGFTAQTGRQGSPCRRAPPAIVESLAAHAGAPGRDRGW